MPFCCLCDHNDPDEIVNHVETKHEGLGQYLLLFPNQPVVNAGLQQALEDFELEGKTEYRKGFEKISGQNRRIVVNHGLGTKPSRSEIIVEYAQGF